MNDKNFDSLKNLKAPEKWIENAKKIPQIQEKKPIFFIRYSKSIAAVACLMLVCAVSLMIVLQKDDGKILVIDPDSQITSTEHKTENTENTEESISIADDKKEIDSQSKKENSQNKNTNTENGGAPFEDSQSTTTPTQNQNSTEAEKPSNADRPASSDVTPTDKEHSAPTQVSTQGQEAETELAPSQRPTHPRPTKPPLKPVNKPNSGSGEMLPAIPSEGAPEVPSQPSNPTISQSMATSFYVYNCTSTNYYCIMFDPDGKLIGDDDLFSEKRKTILVREYADFIIVNYYPKDHYKLTKLGRYTYLLYDENGNLLQQHYIDAEY